MSQNQTILKHLLQGKSITDPQARELYNVRRLSARIKNLRENEHPIKTLIIEDGKKKIAKYYIENPQQTLNY